MDGTRISSEVEVLLVYIDIQQHVAINGKKKIVEKVVLEAISNHGDKPLFVNIDLTDKKIIIEVTQVLIDSFIVDNFGLKDFLRVAKKDITTLSNKFLKPLDDINNPNKVTVSEFQVEIQEILNFISADNIQSNIESLVSTFELIDNIAEAINKKVVIYVDEFQKLIEFPGVDEKDVMWPLRSVIQDSKNITFIIRVNELTAVKKLILNPDSAFYMSFMISDI